MNKDSAKNSTKSEKAAADLYWLAFLLTGRRDISIDIAADAAASEDQENPFFADWMRGWYRRLMIVKALAAIHDELAESAHRTETARFRTHKVSRSWSLGPDVTKEDLERALLAIDLFPRAAVLLLVFEGIRIADAVPLLDAKPDLLKKAQAIGLSELTASLAGTKANAGTVSPPRKFDIRSVMEIPKKLFCLDADCPSLLRRRHSEPSEKS
jgi:integrase